MSENSLAELMAIPIEEPDSFPSFDTKEELLQVMADGKYREKMERMELSFQRVDENP